MKRIQHPMRLCRWPGCEKQVPVRLWGCEDHWKRVPSDLLRALWLEFRPGQETDLQPSEGWVRAEQAIQDHITKLLAKEAAEDAALASQIEQYVEALAEQKQRAKVYRYRRVR